MKTDEGGLEKTGMELSWLVIFEGYSRMASSGGASQKALRQKPTLYVTICSMVTTAGRMQR
jgi:hypothetical protein